MFGSLLLLRPSFVFECGTLLDINLVFFLRVKMVTHFGSECPPRGLVRTVS